MFHGNLTILCFLHLFFVIILLNLYSFYFNVNRKSYQDNDGFKYGLAIVCKGHLEMTTSLSKFYM